MFWPAFCLLLLDMRGVCFAGLNQCCTDVRYGTKRTFICRRMSAFGGKADIVLAITFGNSLWNRWVRSMLSR